MAIAFGAITTRQVVATGTGPTVTGSDTIGWVYHFGDTSDNLTGITWGGVSMTKAATVQVPGDRYCTAWYVTSPSSGASIVCSGSTVNSWFGFYYTGASQTGIPDSFATNTATGGTNISATTTVVAADCWLIMMVKDNQGGVTYTPSIGTMRANAQGGGEAIADSNGTVGTGSQGFTLSSATSANRAAILVSIAPAVAAANTTNFFMMM